MHNDNDNNDNDSNKIIELNQDSDRFVICRFYVCAYGYLMLMLFIIILHYTNIKRRELCNHMEYSFEMRYKVHCKPTLTCSLFLNCNIIRITCNIFCNTISILKYKRKKDFCIVSRLFSHKQNYLSHFQPFLLKPAYPNINFKKLLTYRNFKLLLT